MSANPNPPAPTPLEVGPGLVGAYRAATAPAPMLALLDYVDELHRQLAEARSFYQDSVRGLLVAWKEDCHAQSPGASATPFFKLKCGEQTGRSLDESAASVERPQPWPTAWPRPQAKVKAEVHGLRP